MAIYLAPWVGKGTYKNMYRVLEQVENPGAGMLDLHSGPRKLGHYAVLSLPDESKNPRLIKIADDRRERVGRFALNQIRNRLDSSQTTNRLDVIIAKMMRHPPAGRWNPLRPNRHKGEYRIWLAGEKIYSEPLLRGGATDSFTRADETPIASPWTKETGSNVNLTTNAAQKSASSDNTWYYYSGSVSSADQYAQAVELSGAADWGPAVRISGGASVNGYVLDPYLFGNLGILKYVAGSFSNVTGVGGASYSIGQTIRLEIEGDDLQPYTNGTPHASGFPFTDTDVASAGDGAGLWMYGSGVRVDDWEGGDLNPPAPGASQRFMWTP